MPWTKKNMMYGAREKRRLLRFRSAGQALVEFAVFSAIFVMILGVMISYGLKYNYNQQAQMLAFRRALKIAADPGRGSGSYMLIQDRHIPDATDSFGIGSTMPIIASASVTRDPTLDAQPVDINSVSSTVMDVEEGNIGVPRTVRRIVYPNAGFRIEKLGVSEDAVKAMLSKYQLIYGSALQTPGATGWDVRVLDSCLSPVISYETCYEQAVNIVDYDYCYEQCMYDKNKTATDCATTCGQVLNPPNQNNSGYDPARGGPWYAANYIKHGPDVQHAKTWYVFPELDKMFTKVSGSSKTMGLQASDKTVSNTEKATSFHKMETSSQIVTEESATWSQSQPRNFVQQENIDLNTAYEIPRASADAYADQVNTETIDSEFKGNITQTWSTEK